MMPLNDCVAVEIMAKSVYIRFGYMARSVLSVLGIVAMAILCKIRCNYMHFHPNARLLLHTYILWNLLLSISLLIMNVTNVIRFSTHHSDWCNYLIQAKIGYPIRALSLIAIFGIELTMLSLCIERAIAVFAYSKYEKSTSRKLAYVMIVFQVISFLHCAYGLTSLVVLHGLLIINNVRLYRCKQKSGDSCAKTLRLGEKYQLQENEQSIRSVLPLFWTTFVLNNIAAVALIIRDAIWSSLNQTASLIYTDFFYNVLIFLPFAVFALMLSKFPHLRQKLKFWRTYSTTTTEITLNRPSRMEQIQKAEGKEYFDYLRSQWSEASRQKRSTSTSKRLVDVIRFVI